MTDSARAVRRVIDAWIVEGPAPEIHRAAQERLRREWPALAKAVEALTHSLDVGDTEAEGAGDD